MPALKSWRMLGSTVVTTRESRPTMNEASEQANKVATRVALAVGMVDMTTPYP